MLHEGQSEFFEVKTSECFQVKTSDDFTLAVETSGDDTGVPVVLLHGTPGSRHGPVPRASVLYRLGVQLITYDRPGYGGSTRRPNRRVADTVNDVLAIMDDLGHERFAIVGRSGGGPHALACAALCRGRVTRAAALVSLAPAHATGLDWYSGMTHANVDEYAAADADTAELAQRLQRVADRTAVNPESILDDLRAELTTADRRAVSRANVRWLLADTYAEALRHGAGGWVDDVLAVRDDWGFDLDDISVPVLLWHGEDDNLSPVSHTRWMASRIPNAKVRIDPGSAHFGAMDVLPEILSWLGAGGDTIGSDRPEQDPAALSRVGELVRAEVVPLR